MKGKLSISRAHAQSVGDHINITIADANNGVQFLDVSVSMEEFALAVTGASHQPCTFELRGLANIGKRLEHKTVLVKFPGTGYSLGNSASANKAAALKPYEVDGWRGRPADLGNYHCANDRDDAYNVLFTRYVDELSDQAENKTITNRG